jgi:DNA mismatch endonuclease (patch repair protein)
MARVRSANTRPEVLLRTALWARGLRYRKHRRVLGFRPDLTFPGPRLALFVDGCFWHGCPLHYVFPRTRRDFWSAKLERNVRRDQEQTRRLMSDGWRVLRFLEHELTYDLEDCLERAEDAVRGGSPSFETRRVVRVVAVPGPGDREIRYEVDLLDPTWTDQLAVNRVIVRFRRVGE